MKKIFKVLVGKPNGCKHDFNAEVVAEVGGEILYGVGSTAKLAIADLNSMLEEVNGSRARRGLPKLSPVFEYKFDVAGLFSYYSYLNIGEVAKKMGINPGLMRRYAAGETQPSEKRLTEIEACLRAIATEMNSVRLEINRTK